MNIVIAVALLALLLVHIGEQSHCPAQRKTRAGNEEELDWIDELELFDAALDEH